MIYKVKQVILLIGGYFISESAFNSLCICGIALYFIRDVLERWTKHFSAFLCVYLGLGFCGNILADLGFAEHFFVNVRHRAELLLSRLSNCNVLPACS